MENEPTVVEFGAFYFTKIEDLIALKKEYKEKYVPEVLKELKENSYSTILFKRIGQKQKILKGEATEITENGFIFLINKSKDATNVSSKEEDENENEEILYEKIHVRFNNVLGWIPFLPSSFIEEPWENTVSEITKNFLEFLVKAKGFSRECIDQKHKATFYLRKGNNEEKVKEVVDGKILEVNDSNIVIEQYRSTIFKNGEPTGIILTLKKQRVILYVGLEAYLQKVEISLNTEHDIPPYDDNYSSRDEEVIKL